MSNLVAKNFINLCDNTEGVTLGMSHKDDNHRNEFIINRAMVMSIEKEYLLNLEKGTENKVIKTKKM